MTRVRLAPITSIGVGVLIGVVLQLLLNAMPPWSASAKGSLDWIFFVDRLGGAMLAVAPGVSAGYVARNSPFWAGAVAGLLTTLLYIAFIGFVSPAVFKSGMPDNIEMLATIGGGLGALFTNGIAGIAGSAIARDGLPSNPTVERDARKDSARPSP